MDTNKVDLLGPALSRIGERIMYDIGGDPDGIYLYVEIGEGWVGPSLFKDEGDKISYIDLDDLQLDRLLMEAWRLEPEDKRWTGMEYTIGGGKFDATFQFDDLTAYDGSDDRRQQFLRARYADRPIVYPIWEGSIELKPPS